MTPQVEENKIELTSEIGAQLVDSMGDDESVIHAARVSIVGAAAETEEGERKGLLGFLMRNRHASPFEHVTATFLLDVPIFVTREIHRHRTFSYNEMSGRYTVLKPKFYAPDLVRPLIQVGKPGAYTFELPEDDAVYYTIWRDFRFVYQTAWDTYRLLLEQGVAKEVARDVLPVGIYTSFYMTGNLRNWMNFLALRSTKDALHEIRQVSNQIESQLHKIAPTCMSLWVENGRNSL